MFIYFEEKVDDSLSKMGHKNPSEYAPRPNMRPGRVCAPQNSPLKNMRPWAHFPQAVYGIIYQHCDNVQTIENYNLGF